jgi:hypothetical protein
LSHGFPVLLNRDTGTAYGPRDLVMMLCPSWGFVPASDAVRRLAKMKQLDEEELALVGRFIKGTKGDERQ